LKAAYLIHPKTIEIREVAVPQPGPGQVLVRVRAVGVCGSDVHYYLEGRIGDSIATEPHIMGHEFAGEIAALGAGVTGLRVGQLVAVEPAISCGHCELCREGHPNLCLHIRFMSVPPDQGALAEYVLVEPERCFPLPEGLTAEDGAMLEPLGVALHTMRLAKMLIGDTVAVVGCGPIGLLVLQLVRASGGLNLFATDKLDYRLEYARRYGARTVVNVDREDPVARLAEVTGGRGADLVIEASGSVEGPEQAVRLVRNGGKVLLIGIPAEDELTMTAGIVRRKGLTIKMVRRMKHTYPRAIALAQAGMVDLRSMVTHRFSLEDAGRAFDLVAEEGDGVVKAMVAIG
jgi:L-iditol 2-dehydrogenase